MTNIFLISCNLTDHGFLTVVNEYAKNQKNTGHFVVISISATYGEVAEKFSKNNLSLVYIGYSDSNDLNPHKLLIENQLCTFVPNSTLLFDICGVKLPGRCFKDSHFFSKNVCQDTTTAVLSAMLSSCHVNSRVIRLRGSIIETRQSYARRRS